MKTRTLALLLALLASLAPTALARVEFAATPFTLGEFRDADKVAELCAAPAASAFLCRLQEEELTRIPTKGVDYFFDDAGELVAAFSKAQKGQTLGSYSLDNRQNLIPLGTEVPGLAVLVDGAYAAPEAVEGSWRQASETTFEGVFRYRTGGIDVEKRVVVSNTSHTLEVELLARRPEGAAGGTAADAEVVQLAVPGIARADDPVAKIGTADAFSVDPLPQPVQDPAYVSLQTSRRGTGQALVLRPGSGQDELAGIALAGDLVALQAPLPSAAIAAELYVGPNELVRYTQEGYADLPGLFDPNILGRLSLGIIWVLQQIHEVVGSWGLAIIVLTLLFRALIWPLIATQTKSMFGMQQLQPQIQALQKKYKDDRETLTQETMKLYKEAGVNPAGGCLPILLQMPLFIILWRVFVNFEFNEGFVWIPDLGQPDPFYILPALYVAVMVAQSFFAAKGNKQMLQQQLIMNLVFVFIMINFPAGVLLYFVVSMLVQVFQYWLLSRNQPPAPAMAGAGGGLFGALLGGGAQGDRADAKDAKGSAKNAPQKAKAKTKGKKAKSK